MREREQAKQAAEQCEEEDPEPVAMKRPAAKSAKTTGGKKGWPKGKGDDDEPKPKPAKTGKKGDDEPKPKPAKKGKQGDDDEPEPKPAKRGKKGDDEPEPKPAKRGRKGEDDEPKPKPAKKGKPDGDDDPEPKPAKKGSKPKVKKTFARRFEPENEGDSKCLWTSIRDAFNAVLRPHFRYPVKFEDCQPKSNPT